MVITTAPTQRQVEELLWREARGAYHSAVVPLGGRFYQRSPHWNLSSKNYALGVSPEHTSPEKFHGFHSDLLVFIVDEASDVPEEHWEAMKGSALAGKGVILAIGNPTTLNGQFFEAFHGQAELWRGMKISAFECPNLVGQRSIKGLVNAEGVEQARKDWGEGSPQWRVRVLGEFPTSGSNGLVMLEWTEAAQKVAPEPGKLVMGVDVAGEGGDESAIALMDGNRVLKLDAWKGEDPLKGVGKIKEIYDAYPSRQSGMVIAVDDGGLGGMVVPRLRELGISARPVQFGGRPDGRRADYFRNRGSEMYWNLREALRDGKLSMAYEPKLFSQLLRIEWELQSDKAIWVHKRGVKERAPSPDRADALALAWEAKRLAGFIVGFWAG